MWDSIVDLKKILGILFTVKVMLLWNNFYDCWFTYSVCFILCFIFEWKMLIFYWSLPRMERTNQTFSFKIFENEQGILD